MSAARFRFTGSGSVYAPAAADITRDVPTLDTGRAARSRQLTFEIILDGNVGSSRDIRIEFYKRQFAALSAALKTKTSVLIDDMFLNRYCYAVPQSIRTERKGVVYILTATFIVPSGVWNTIASYDPNVYKVEVNGDGSPPYMTVDASAGARGMRLVMFAPSLGSVGSANNAITLTRLTHNLCYDSGFQNYERVAATPTASEGVWKGLDALAPWGSPNDAGDLYALYASSATTAATQRIPCIAGNDYIFSAEVRLPQDVANPGTPVLQTGAGTARLEMQFRDKNGAAVGAVSHTNITAQNIWQEINVSATAGSGALWLDATIKVLTGNALVCKPQVSEGDTVLPFINTSDDEYKPADLVWDDSITALSGDNIGVVFIDTEKKEALTRLNAGGVAQPNWMGASGRVSGSWIPLMPGVNHIRLPYPNTSGATMKFLVSLNNEELI